MRTPYLVVVTSLLGIISLAPSSADALSLLDFNTENSGSIFFTFCPLEGTPTDDLPNSSELDLGQVELALAITWDDTHLLFEFVNRSQDGSSISEIYMDDRNSNRFGNGTFDTSLSSDGLLFVDTGAPAKLPAGNTLTPKFWSNPELDFYAVSPSPENGVNPGENLVLAYDVFDFGTLGVTDDLAAIVSALDTGGLRIGIHVQSIGLGGKSDSFLACPMDGGTPPPFPPINPVPAPSTGILVGLGVPFLLTRMRFHRS